VKLIKIVKNDRRAELHTERLLMEVAMKVEPKLKLRVGRGKERAYMGADK
jgi:hypothetical protein